MVKNCENWQFWPILCTYLVMYYSPNAKKGIHLDQFECTDNWHMFFKLKKWLKWPKLGKNGKNCPFWQILVCIYGHISFT